ncbi:mersacidin family lantibiotic [Butyrivibrio sp. INlla21]|uniref:mersacidin family lantibiotic n=1 Tax=Butyrivibrio sp. INlla21 TaxID=1520811 RepID=UPI0008DF426E|nr:lichenicidin A2 family type 2 lantibiotic [Butyrivibrio sp. INlla21]SFU96273.1 type 2 lantibiotic, SP_1948 family [Butyrivibrio sp. INlla21]
MGEKEINKVVGNSFEELGAEDMQQTQGAGDVNPEVVSNCFTLTPSVIVANPSLVSVSLLNK